LNLNVMSWPLGSYGSGRDRVGGRMQEGVASWSKFKVPSQYLHGVAEETLLKNLKPGHSTAGIKPRTYRMRSQCYIPTESRTFGMLVMYLRIRIDYKDVYFIQLT